MGLTEREIYLNGTGNFKSLYSHLNFFSENKFLVSFEGSLGERERETNLVLHPWNRLMSMWPREEFKTG